MATKKKAKKKAAKKVAKKTAKKKAVKKKAVKKLAKPAEPKKTGTTGGKATSQKITDAHRRSQAIKLRMGGATYEDIGASLGVTKQRAHAIVRDYMNKVEDETCEDTKTIKQLEVQRLDRLVLGLWTRATAGQVGAIDRMIKIMERRAKLLGLDGAIKVARTDPTGEHEVTERTDEERVTAILGIIESQRKSGA